MVKGILKSSPREKIRRYYQGKFLSVVGTKGMFFSQQRRCCWSEDMSVDQRTQVNPELISLGPGSDLPLKGDQNINEPVSIDSVKKEQQIPKKKILRSLRNFPYELIYCSWYRDDDGNIFKQILSEVGIKNNLTRLVKLLFVAAEIIRDRDLGEKRFLNNLNHFYY